MGISAVMQLGGKMARRNHLYLFAWLCAIAVPGALQLISGQIDEVRDSMAYYFGPLTLYMFFAMTYGFATVFVSYYLVGGYRHKGSLDILRVARIRPWEVIAGVFLALQRVLVPPLLVFAAGFVIYLLVQPEEGFIQRDPWLIAGFGLLILANEAILSSVMLLGLFRREAPLALIAAPLVFLLNAMPVVLIYTLGWPTWAYAAMLVGLVIALLAVAALMVGRLWPPQRLPRRGA